MIARVWNECVFQLEIFQFAPPNKSMHAILFSANRQLLPGYPVPTVRFRDYFTVRSWNRLRIIHVSPEHNDIPTSPTERRSTQFFVFFLSFFFSSSKIFNPVIVLSFPFTLFKNILNPTSLYTRTLCTSHSPIIIIITEQRFLACPGARRVLIKLLYALDEGLKRFTCKPRKRIICIGILPSWGEM